MTTHIPAGVRSIALIHFDAATVEVIKIDCGANESVYVARTKEGQRVVETAMDIEQLIPLLEMELGEIKSRENMTP